MDSKYLSYIIATIMPVWAGVIAFGIVSASLLFQSVAWFVVVVGFIGVFFGWIASAEASLKEIPDDKLKEYVDQHMDPSSDVKVTFFRFGSLCTIIFCYLSGFYWLAGMWTLTWLAGYFVQHDVRNCLFAEAHRRNS